MLGIIHHPVPAEPQARRWEMIRLRQQGWSEKSIAPLLHCTRPTVYKWLRRWAKEQERGLRQAESLLAFSLRFYLGPELVKR